MRAQWSGHQPRARHSARWGRSARPIRFAATSARALRCSTYSRTAPRATSCVERSALGEVVAVPRKVRQPAERPTPDPTLPVITQSNYLRLETLFRDVVYRRLCEMVAPVENNGCVSRWVNLPYWAHRMGVAFGDAKPSGRAFSLLSGDEPCSFIYHSHLSVTSGSPLVRRITHNPPNGAVQVDYHAGLRSW